MADFLTLAGKQRADQGIKQTLLTEEGRRENSARVWRDPAHGFFPPGIFRKGSPIPSLMHRFSLTSTPSKVMSAALTCRLELHNLGPSHKRHAGRNKASMVTKLTTEREQPREAGREWGAAGRQQQLGASHRTTEPTHKLGHSISALPPSQAVSQVRRDPRTSPGITEPSHHARNRDAADTSSYDPRPSAASHGHDDAPITWGPRMPRQRLPRGPPRLGHRRRQRRWARRWPPCALRPCWARAPDAQTGPQSCPCGPPPRWWGRKGRTSPAQTCAVGKLCTRRHKLLPIWCRGTQATTTLKPAKPTNPSPSQQQRQ
jgi:hypothetical protein